MHHVISIGRACQTAHQLRRLGLAQETMFYDWLVTKHDRLLDTLDLDLDDRLLCRGFSFAAAGNHLIDTGTGLSFYAHDFRGIPEGDARQIEQQIPSVREQYLRRARRTRDALSSGAQVTIVRHFFSEPLDELDKQQSEIVSLLARFYPQTTFLFIWGSELIDRVEHTRFGQIHPFPKTSEWRGIDAAWDAAVAYEAICAT